MVFQYGGITSSGGREEVGERGREEHTSRFSRADCDAVKKKRSKF